MKSDPKDCLYCQNNETLHNLNSGKIFSTNLVFCIKIPPNEISANKIITKIISVLFSAFIFFISFLYLLFLIYFAQARC